MARLALKTAIGRYGHTLPLMDGSVVSERLAFDWAEYETIVGVFRTMVRTSAYEVSEMALSTYLCARAHGKPMTAIPVFITRSFNHGDVVYNANSGIGSPRDLAGKRVGVRAYTVTPGVWARGILKHEHGLDLDAVTWVLGSDEHVAEFVEPPNVVSAPAGSDLGGMLLSGDLDAAIGVGGLDSARIRPLIPDARDAALRFHEETGVYPDKPHCRHQERRHRGESVASPRAVRSVRGGQGRVRESSRHRCVPAPQRRVHSAAAFGRRRRAFALRHRGQQGDTGDVHRLERGAGHNSRAGERGGGVRGGHAGAGVGGHGR